MFYSVRLRLFLPFVFAALFSSCVGTVEDAATKKTLTSEYEKNEIIFAGVQKVVPISHNKIEVYFYPADGGSGKYTYKIYYGGNPLPAVTASDVLNTDYRGLLRFTLTGLEASKEYLIRVDVEDQVGQSYHKSAEFLAAKTFSNIVADFYGASQVSNLSGVDGTDSVKLRWIHAECANAMRCDQDSDPARYELILLDRTNMGLNPSDFDNRDLNQEDGRIVKLISYDKNINEGIVRGLRPDTEYYVLVRSIHKGSIEDINNPELRSELNNSYLMIKTLSDDLASIDFDTAGLQVLSMQGEDAKSALEAKWGDVVGVFDHFRLFYAPQGAGLSASTLPESCDNALETGESAETTTLCKKLPYYQTNSIVAGLLPQTDYNFILVVCQTQECGSGERLIGDMKQGKTSGEEPGFGGIQAILQARSISDFGSLTLTFEPVDSSRSYIDGYVVEYKDNPASTAAAEYAVQTLDSPDYQDGDLFTDPYDARSASKIKVWGVEYYANKTYCFRIYPFVYNATGDKEVYTNEKWECVNTPTYSPPSQAEFKGLRALRTEGRSITLRWEPPVNGVYEEYEIYYVNKGTNKNLFGSAPVELDDPATASTSDYGRIIVDAGVTEFNLSGFPEDTTWEFGILTNFNSAQGKLRSEENTNLVVCNFKDGVNQDCVGGF